MPASQPVATLGDIELARRVARRDAVAFEALMRRYNARLFRVARAEEWASVRARLLLQDIVPIGDESPYEQLLHYETEARALGYPDLQ